MFRRREHCLQTVLLLKCLHPKHRHVPRHWRSQSSHLPRCSATKDRRILFSYKKIQLRIQFGLQLGIQFELQFGLQFELQFGLSEVTKNKSKVKYSKGLISLTSLTSQNKSLRNSRYSCKLNQILQNYQRNLQTRLLFLRLTAASCHTNSLFDSSVDYSIGF